MTVSKKATELTKYILRVPSLETSILLIIIISFFAGIIEGVLEPGLSFHDFVYIFFMNGTETFFLFGLTSMIVGGLEQKIINITQPVHSKMKHTMFLSLITLMIIVVFYILGTTLTYFTRLDVSLSLLIIGLIMAYAINTLIIWTIYKLKYGYALIISAINPLIIVSMLVLVRYLQDSMILNSIISVYLYFTLGAIVLSLVVYSFIQMVMRPFKNNLGLDGLELIYLFASYLSEESDDLETVFDNIGEEIDTTVGIVSFKNKDGVKTNFISPNVHPGPVGSIGGGNMPTILAQQLDDFTIVAHGTATHDFNPVTKKEISKITNAINESLKDLEYSSMASEFKRVESDDAKIGYQYFNNGLVLLSTFAPLSGDDIDYGVGSTLSYEAKYITDIEDVLFVDCHNSLESNYEKLLPGHQRVRQLENAVSKIEKLEQYPIELGVAYNPLDDIPIVEGIGESGVKIMITCVNQQYSLYVVIDGNNMKQGYRDELIDLIQEKYPLINQVEIMTTDTHMVNTFRNGGPSVATFHKEEITDAILNLIPEALDNLEPVEVATKTIRILIKTVGPENTNTLVTTVTSIISIITILAPLIIIVAIIILLMLLL
ncbi:MAG: DUF2070 family protein [Methanosphaera sp.]|nr:DUF2070 family protein [Methanosphaera sp.]